MWENDGSGRFTRIGGPRRPIPPNPNADAGSSHTLQYVGLRVDHSELRSGRPGWVTAIAYADFDLDGDIDVFHAPVVESGAPQPVEFHVNNGNNEFSLHDGLLNGAAPRLSNATKAVSGDYNGLDGRADIVVVGAGRSYACRRPGNIPDSIVAGWISARFRIGLFRRNVLHRRVGGHGCRR